ncbi:MULTISPECIES: DUF3783 domain-containing protein [Helcococcus]|uniref:DUF3783 domain-containing protein n=1 Tax=Helcococcus bovis TaxID=3153252 RepID=A0ABW9F8D9_9FIRM
MTEKNILDNNEKIILIYGIKNKRYKSLIEQANKYNYRVIEVLDNQLNCEIENLLSNNISNCIDEKSEKIDIEFLLFVNIIKDELYKFIDELKRKKLYFANKAILTQTNLKWKLRTLLVENKKEHLVMTLFTNLRRSMKKAEILRENGIFDDELLEIMVQAKKFMNPQEFDFSEIKEIHNKLSIKVNSLEGKHE